MIDRSKENARFPNPSEIRNGHKGRFRPRGDADRVWTTDHPPRPGRNSRRWGEDENGLLRGRFGSSIEGNALVICGLPSKKRRRISSLPAAHDLRDISATRTNEALTSLGTTAGGCSRGTSKRPSAWPQNWVVVSDSGS